MPLQYYGCKAGVCIILPLSHSFTYFSTHELSRLAYLSHMVFFIVRSAARDVFCLFNRFNALMWQNMQKSVG